MVEQGMVTVSDLNERQRVAFVLPALSAGGAERVIITLLNGLDRTKYDPYLVLINEKGPLGQLVDPSIPLHVLGKPKVFPALPELYRHLKSAHPDIIVSTMAHMNFGCLLIKPFLRDKHFIVREAVTPSYFFKENIWREFLIRTGYRVLYPSASRVISPAQVITHEFKNLLGMKCENHVLLPNPVNVKHIRAHENGPLPVRTGGVNFIAAGRLHPQKGFDRLIEHISNANFSHDWRLTILGEGSERAALEALIREKGFGDKISLPGLIDNPWPHYAAADCFLLPSRYEGLPNVVLEALACGTPVIATRESGGIAEIQANAPESVTVVNNMDEFIEAMQNITPDPATVFRPSLLPDCYTKEAVIKQFESILNEVVSV